MPNKMGNSYSDFLATWTALGALMAALLRRARTGEGQWIDLAMYQTGTTVIGAGVLDFAFNGLLGPVNFGGSRAALSRCLTGASAV